MQHPKIGRWASKARCTSWLGEDRPGPWGSQPAGENLHRKPAGFYQLKKGCSGFNFPNQFYDIGVPPKTTCNTRRKEGQPVLIDPNPKSHWWGITAYLQTAWPSSWASESTLDALVATIPSTQCSSQCFRQEKHIIHTYIYINHLLYPLVNVYIATVKTIFSIGT